MKIRELLKTDGIVSVLKKVEAARPKTSHSLLIKAAAISISLVIAFSIRLLPVRWGFYMSEFDPYYQYRNTKYIVENGFFGDGGWISWHDYLSWYPWGNVMRDHSYLGLTLTAAALFLTLKTLGVPLAPNPTLDPLLSDPVYVLCVIFPAIMATLTCLIIYFLGKDLGGEAVGMFAALFLALDSSYIGRTSLGWFDDETVGMFSLLLFILFFLRSIDKSKPIKRNIFYAIAAGLSLGYLCASWGASRYPIVMTALFALILLISGMYSVNLLFSCGLTMLLALSIAASVPYLGTGFLLEVEFFPVYGVLLLLCITEANRHAKTLRQRLALLLFFVGVAMAFFAVLWTRGMITGLETKFQTVLNPFLRFETPIVESVAEHRPSAWGTFYYSWGIGILFLPVGLFFAATMMTNESLFMVIYGLTSIFFASSMIRLTVMMSPVVSLLWALALVRILRPFILFLREAPDEARRKPKFRGVLGKETAAAILALMFVLFALTYVVGTDFVAGPLAEGPKVYTQAYSPTTLGSASLSARPTDTVHDWINALTWMRENLPPSPRRPGDPGTVVASWWDYGYWITTIANRTSLADNGTWNWTQIEQIGTMFMSNETEAIKILKRYDVTHVVVFTTFDTQGRIIMGGGDEGKWEWMARIPGLDKQSNKTIHQLFGNYTLGLDWVDYSRDGQPQSGELLPNSQGENTTLYKLMHYGRETTIWGYSQIQLEHFEKAYFSQEYTSEGPVPGPAPGTSYIPLVCVYKVNYPPE